MQGPLTPIRIQESEIADYRFFAPDEIPDDTFQCCKQKARDWAGFTGQTVFR
jgi:hypothetical protein